MHTVIGVQDLGSGHNFSGILFDMSKKTVKVPGYVRKDGTPVAAHTKEMVGSNYVGFFAPVKPVLDTEGPLAKIHNRIEDLRRKTTYIDENATAAFNVALDDMQESPEGDDLARHAAYLISDTLTYDGYSSEELSGYMNGVHMGLTAHTHEQETYPQGHTDTESAIATKWNQELEEEMGKYRQFCKEADASDNIGNKATARRIKETVLPGLNLMRLDFRSTTSESLREAKEIALLGTIGFYMKSEPEQSESHRRTGIRTAMEFWDSMTQK